MDGIRAIAILLVIGFHYINNQIIIPTNSKALDYLSIITSEGWCGVDLFFVLSGFLICGILMRNKRSRNYFQTFYTRRSLRIFPLYYLLLFTYLLVKHLGLCSETDIVFEQQMSIPYYFFYFQNIIMGLSNNFGPHYLNPTWSLAVEEQFYLLFPVIIYLLRNKILPYFFISLFFIAPVFRYFTTNWYQYYTWLPSRLDSFAIGALIAYLIEERNLKSLLADWKFPMEMALLLAFLFTAFIHIYYGLGIFKFTFLAIIFSILLLITIVKKESIVSKILRHPFLQTIGIISYGLYIYHLPILLITQNLLQNQRLRLQTLNDVFVTIIALIITLFVSLLSYKYFELPILYKSRKFKY